MGSRRVLAVRLLGPVAVALAVVAGGMSPASAAPATLPAPVQRLAEVAGHHLVKANDRAGQRQALAVPGNEDDQDYIEVVPSCASGKKKAKVEVVVYTGTKVKLDYVLTGTGLRKTGTLKTKADRPVSFDLPSVRKGGYRLTLALHGKTDLIADRSFDVLPCVTVKASCRAVTFTNPAGNPAAYGFYSGHKKNQDFELDLAPGESITVRADYAKIDYDLTADDYYSGLGHGTIKVKQSCTHGPAQPGDHALQTSGFAGCAEAGAPATVELGWSVQPSLKKLGYEVLDTAQHVLAAGTVKGGHGTDLSLAAGSYTYRSHANGLSTPFEDVAFVVLACVEVKPHCQALELRNPNAVAVFVDVTPADDDADDDDYIDPVLVGAGQTVTIPWHSRGAYAVAYLDDPTSFSQSSFFSLASPAPWDDDLGEITVPQNC